LGAVVIREFNDHLYIHYVGSGKGGWIDRYSRRLMPSKNQDVWDGRLRGVQWTLPDDIPAIRRLLKLGCDVNLRSANPVTNPLCVAIERGWSYETIELLLECKADLFSRNPYNNQTPLWSLSARESDDTLRGEDAKPLMELAWMLISRGAWSDLMATDTTGITVAEKLHGDLSKLIQLCTFRCLHFIDECVTIDVPKEHALPPHVAHIIQSYLFDVHPYERYPLHNSGLHSEEQKEQYQCELLLGDDDEDNEGDRFIQSRMTSLRRMQLCRFSVECMEQDRIDDYLRLLWFQTVYRSAI